MNNREKYVSAMKKIKFRENLKQEILEKMELKFGNQGFHFLPKTAISLACIQGLFCFFAVQSVSYFGI